jgi:hypothetical protein
MRYPHFNGFSIVHRYGQIVADDSTSAILAEFAGNSTSPPALQYVTTTFDNGVAKLVDLIVEASLGVTVPIEISLPSDDAVAPAIVDLAFAAQCQAGFETFETTQGNTVCRPCAQGEYESAGKCSKCPNGVHCKEASTVIDWEVKAGHWRTNDESDEVFKCRYGVTSCPGENKNQASMYSPSQRRATSSVLGPNPYCSPNHVGHLCSACAPDLFLSWAGDGKCYQCATGESHAPTIGLLGGVFVFVVSCLACVYKKSMKKDQGITATAASKPTNSLFSKSQQVYTLAKFKVFTLFLTSQVRLRSQTFR